MAVLSPALDPAQPTGLLAGGRFDQRNEDLAVLNPYTGEEIARVAVGGPDDVDAPRGSRGGRGSSPTAPRPSRGRSASRRASR
jgi:acyl-CoA reductase-like NAD-dependent aldehyde dehydrogenase